MSMPLQVRTEPPKPEDVQASYGFVALIAKQIPEIGTLMEQAVRENWTPDRFSLALANTGWWKSTPDGQRQWLVKTIADPASAYTEAATGADQIRNLTAQLGVPMPDAKTAQDWWLWTKVAGYDENGTRAYIARTALDSNFSAAEPGGGRLGQMVNDMWKLSQDYGYMPNGIVNEISDRAQWYLRTGGSIDTTGWQSQMREYAAAKYAPFADRIRGGETVRDIARPYLDSYSKVLELNAQDISLDDKLMQKALQGDGQAALPVWQFEQELRKDDRYGYTNGARQEAASTVQAIGRAFGMVG